MTSNMNVVICANALENGLLDGVVFDALITDPAYSDRVHARMVSAVSAAKGMRKRTAGFPSLKPEERTAIARLATQAKRWSVIFSDLEGVGKWADELDLAIPCSKQSRNGYVRAVPVTGENEFAEVAGHVGELPWVRWSMPQFSGDRPPQCSEAVVLGHAPGKCRWGGPGNLRELQHSCLRGEGKHPTEKPLDLMLDLVAWFTDPGELVIDPCAGRGTTGVACALLGRRFAGFELQEKEVTLANARIQAAIVGEFVYDRDATRAARWLASVQAERFEDALTLQKGLAR